jgi:hypothetical protein
MNMNVESYFNLLKNPEQVTSEDVIALEDILIRYPYFQSARAVRLKGLHVQDSFKYNYALKVAAAYTADRTMLFDLIVNHETKIQKAEKIDVKIEKKAAETEVTPNKNDAEQSIKNSIDVANQMIENEATLIDKLEIGKPIQFDRQETHSFNEWLQLAKFKTIDRTIEEEQPETTSPIDVEKERKLQIIDKFIESSPKISPVKSGSNPSIKIDINKEENLNLMTETLAKVYLEQKKYLKAIQAYEILILKYPEKSSLFADRIQDIKSLQQNNLNTQ